MAVPEEAKVEIKINVTELLVSQADGQIGVSVSDMLISQQAEIRNMRFTEERKWSTTTIIVKEEEADDSILYPQEEKKKKKDDDNTHFLGYFKWYWGHNGFFKAFKDFFGRRILYGCIFSIFNSIGSAVGAFFFKKFVIMKTDLAEFV